MPHELDEARSVRIAREREMLAAAEDDFRQGRYISGDAAEAWLDQWAAGASTDELLAIFESHSGN